MTKRELNYDVQTYKGIKLRLRKRDDYENRRAKQFRINETTTMEGRPIQKVWIPNTFLDESGTLKPDIDIDFVFNRAHKQRKLEYAGLQTTK